MTHEFSILVAEAAYHAGQNAYADFMQRVVPQGLYQPYARWWLAGFDGKPMPKERTFDNV